MEPLIHLFPHLRDTELEHWNHAYVRVETYFASLRIRNREFLSHTVQRSLQNAMSRAAREPGLEPVVAAMQEAERLVDQWIGTIMGTSQTHANERHSAKGRLAMLLSNVPTEQQQQFLEQERAPAEVLPGSSDWFHPASARREAIIMRPQPLNLGLMGTLAEALERPRPSLLFLTFLGVLVYLLLT